jgi:hypothetical protein
MIKYVLIEVHSIIQGAAVQTIWLDMPVITAKLIAKLIRASRGRSEEQ